MARLIQPVGRVSQAGAFRSRDNRLGRADPSRGLFVTHRYALTETVIPADAFPVADTTNEPLTCAFTVRAGSAESLIVGVGSPDFNNRGFSIAILGNNVFFRAGEANPGTEGFFVSTSPDAPLVDGGLGAKIVAAVNPGTGFGMLWLDGVPLLRGQAAAGNFGTLGWNGGADGGILSSANTLLASDIEFSVRQRPRQLDV